MVKGIPVHSRPMVTIFPVREACKSLAASHKIKLESTDVRNIDSEKHPLFEELVKFIDIGRADYFGFSGEGEGIAIAYVGRNVQQDSEDNNETAWIRGRGRLVQLTANENQNGQVSVLDEQLEEAVRGLRYHDFSRGSAFDKRVIRSTYLWERESDSAHHPGVKKFLDIIMQ